jgi:hypothetical protein
MRLTVWACLLCLAGIPAAARADVFAYEQDNGTKAFTDKIERVPAKYKAKAQRRPDPKLFEYPRTTIVAVKPEPKKAVRPVEPAPAYVSGDSLASSQPAPRQALIEVTPGISIPVDLEDDSPLRVERRYRWIGGRYTPVTVVSQGERVLAEIERAERF